MQTIICYTNYLPQGKTQEISFLELLLDEKWADGKLEYSKSLYSEIGNKNSILKAKQDYEFLLRAVKNYPLLAVGTALQNSPIHDSQHHNSSSELPIIQAGLSIIFVRIAILSANINRN